MTDALLYLIAIVLIGSNLVCFVLGYLYAKIGRIKVRIYPRGEFKDHFKPLRKYLGE